MKNELFAMTLATVVVSTALPVYASGEYDDSALWEEIDNVDREDMRVKRGEVNGDTLTLRVEDHKKSRGRNFIYGKNVNIDVSDLNQSDEVADLQLNDARIEAKTDQNKSDIVTNSDLISQNSTEIARVEDESIARDQALAADIANNSTEIARVEDESIARDQALAADIANNSTEIARVEDESVERDQALAADIANNSTEIARVEDESIERDTILSETIIRETNDRIIMDNHLQAQVDANRYDINSNYNRIVDTNMRIDLLDDRVSENELRINGLEKDISHLRSDMYSAVAGVAAMGAIPEAKVGRTAVGVGYGNFGGANAGALGVSHRSGSGKHAVTFSTTFSTRQNGVAAGYSYSF